jgi:hypothetical protein
MGDETEARQKEKLFIINLHRLAGQTAQRLAAED